MKNCIHQTLFALIASTCASVGFGQVQLRELSPDAWAGGGQDTVQNWWPSLSGDAANMFVVDSSTGIGGNLAVWRSDSGYQVIVPAQAGYQMRWEGSSVDGARVLFRALTTGSSPWVDAQGNSNPAGYYVWDKNQGVVSIPPFINSSGQQEDVRWEILSGNGQVMSGTTDSGKIVLWDGIQPPIQESWGLPMYARPIALDYEGRRLLAVDDFMTNDLWDVQDGVPEVFDLTDWLLSGLTLQVVPSSTETLLIGDGHRAFLWTRGSDPVQVGPLPARIFFLDASFRADNSEVILTGKRVYSVNPPVFEFMDEYWLARRTHFEEGSIPRFWFSGSPNSGIVVHAESSAAIPAVYAAYFPTAPGFVGENYCGPSRRNSSGFPAYLNAAGSLSIADNALTLLASSLPNNQFGYLLNSIGRDLIDAPAGSMGRLCIGGGFPIGRHQAPGEIGFSGSYGQVATAVNLESIPTPFGNVAAQVGQQWFFQFWYRDWVQGQSTSNFTDAVGVTLE